MHSGSAAETTGDRQAETIGDRHAETTGDRHAETTGNRQTENRSSWGKLKKSTGNLREIGRRRLKR